MLTYPIPYNLVEYVSGFSEGGLANVNVVDVLPDIPKGSMQGVHGLPEQTYPPAMGETPRGG